jgi:cobalt-zinc-cadmium resistance protein CzcA
MNDAGAGHGIVLSTMARERVADTVRLPPGMTIEWGGEFESKERAMARLELVVPIACC